MSRHTLTAELFVGLVLTAAQVRAADFGLLRRIPNPEARPYAQFGNAVAAVGSNVVIGAPNNEFGATTLPGAAYLIDPRTGDVLRTFTRPGSPTHDLFGFAVVALGGDVLIGAPGDPTQGVDNGAVYRFDATTGAFEGQLLEPGPVAGAEREFGYALAVVDGNLLVGTGATTAAHLFDPVSGALLRSFTSAYSWTGALGRAVAAFGHDVLLGAIDDQTPGQIGGAVYRFDGTSGALVSVFFNPTGSASDSFGTRVLAVGGELFVGAPFNGAAGTNAGAVYVFDAASGMLVRTLLVDAYAYFGLALAPTADGVLIGAQRGDAAFLFDPASGALRADFDAPPSAAGAEFGAAVGAVGDLVVVGAPFENAGAAASGAVYLFDGCGSGVRNENEQCDDGNTTDGDGCSAECRLELCSPTPRTDCRKPDGPGGATLLVRNGTPDARDHLTWTWSGALAGDELGDPTGSTSYLLCLYDNGAPSEPVLALAAPAAGTCRTSACWQPSGSAGFVYRDRLETPDGLTQMKLRPASRKTISVTGKGPNLHLPSGTLAAPLTVQLVRTGQSVCWDANFSTMVAVGGRISARSD